MKNRDFDRDFDRHFNRTFKLAGCGIVASILFGIIVICAVIGGIVWLANTPAVQQLLGY